MGAGFVRVGIGSVREGGEIGARRMRVWGGSKGWLGLGVGRGLLRFGRRLVWIESGSGCVGVGSEWFGGVGRIVRRSDRFGGGVG
jgi:hypothetical protein